MLTVSKYIEDASLIYAESVRTLELPPNAGQAWIERLWLEPIPLGLVLPLEMKDAEGRRVGFWGLELLRWLRWSAPAGWRDVPVFAFAFQSLQQVLRLHPDIDLFSEGTTFARLPEALVELPVWKDGVRRGRIKQGSRTETERLMRETFSAAAQRSHHDLANDYYASWRLWRGYRRALGETAASTRKAKDRLAVEREIERVERRQYSWESDLAARIRSPEFQRFRVQRNDADIPLYRPIEESESLTRMHVCQGLPSQVRVLLVDDEIEKGLAEVLLEILFKQGTFTSSCDRQLVWSEEQTGKQGADSPRRWARFVAVPSIEAASCWLSHWGDVPDIDQAAPKGFLTWINRWARQLGVPPRDEIEPDTTREILGENSRFILDSVSAWPVPVTTVVLLDLRLSGQRSEGAYRAADLPSAKFVQRIRKCAARHVPIVILTASRQVLSFLDVMDDCTGLDGWLVKEAPDFFCDDGDLNSSRAVNYLLERAHLFSTLRGWYREDFNWNTSRILAYAKVHNSPKRASILTGIGQRTHFLFLSLLNGQVQRKEFERATFHQFIARHAPALHFEIEQHLVARRLVLAALFQTCSVTDGLLEWDTLAFDKFLPGRPLKPRLKNIYDKLSFNQELWMRTENLLTQLLDEELGWLRTLHWPESRSAAIDLALAQEAQRRAE